MTRITGFVELMIIVNKETKPSLTKPATGIMIKIKITPETNNDTNGVMIKSNTSGIRLRIFFSMTDNTHTPNITPMMPPFPVVNTDSNGTVSLYNPIIFAISMMFAPILIPPIIPPNAGVAPNTSAARIPV